jgi:DNA-binding winged helix-turn-helix (wHTH) protein
MAARRSWQVYPRAYRTREMAILAEWIRVGISGAVVGLAGSGKSNLLGFLGHRPDALRSYLPPTALPDAVALLLVDLNNVPANDLSTLHRAILRGFYEIRDRFDSILQQTIASLYQEYRGDRDPFLLQSALRDLLLLFQARQGRVVLILDRFDHFCQQATPHILDTLRGLRDSFKDTLCFIVGTRQELAYLPDPGILGELYEILDSYTCWVGPLDRDDIEQFILQEIDTVVGAAATIRQAPADSPLLTEDEVAQLIRLTGGYPALLKAVITWLLSRPEWPATGEWGRELLAERGMHYRLTEIWKGLTQEEQRTLVEIQKLQRQAAQARARPSVGQPASAATATQGLATQPTDALARLAAKGLCLRTASGWRIFCELLDAYIATVEPFENAKIWADETTGELYQDQTRLADLAPLERAVLLFFITHPRTRHTKTDIIVNVWPGELRGGTGVADDSLYQVIMALRKKIEPNPSKPCYLVNWRGTIEGGYQFFPEGRSE